MTLITPQIGGFYIAAGDVAPTDPTFDDNVLLAGFDGADGATSYTEESNDARVATFNGGAEIDADGGRFDGALFLDGVDSYVTFPDSDDFQLIGTVGENFTIDLRIRPESTATPASTQYIINQYATSGNQRGWALARVNNGLLSFFYSSTGSSPTTLNILDYNDLPVGTLTTIRIDYDGTHLRFYIDGEMLEKSSYSGTFFNAAVPLTLGVRADLSSGSYWDGRIDEVRIKKGVCVTGSDDGYTVETSKFPRS